MWKTADDFAAGQMDTACFRHDYRFNLSIFLKIYEEQGIPRKADTFLDKGEIECNDNCRYDVLVQY